MKRKFLALVLGAIMMIGVMAGCGASASANAESETVQQEVSTQQEEAAQQEAAAEVVVATVEDSYVCGKTGLSMEFAGNLTEGISEGHNLQLLSDGTFIHTISQVMNVYGSDSSIVTVVYGTYEKGEPEDGIAAVTLNDATRVIYNAYIGVGGIALSVDTDDATCFPAELLGTGVADQTAEDYLAKFGAKTTVYTEETSNCLYFENPAEAL